MFTKLKEFTTSGMLIPPKTLLLVLVLANIGLHIVAKSHIEKYELKSGVVYVSAESKGEYERKYNCTFNERVDGLNADLDCNAGYISLIWNNERSYFNPLGSLRNYFIFRLVCFIIYFICLGVVLFQYFFAKEDSYLFYAGFLLIVIINTSCRVGFELDGNILLYNKIPAYYPFSAFCHSTMYVAYMLFLYDFFRRKEELNMKLTLLYNILTTIPLIFSLFTIGIELTSGYQKIDSGLIRGFALAFYIFGLYFIYSLYQSSRGKSWRGPVNYIIIGAFFVIIGQFAVIFLVQLMDRSSLAASILSSVGYLDQPLIISRIQVITYGATAKIIEFFFMMFGLGLKVKLNKEEQIKLQNDSLIYQLRHHILFNFLTRVKHNIQEENKIKAIDYLDSFSSYLRFILDNTFNRKVKINDELEFSKRYLNIERKSFITPFTYEANVEEELMYSLDIPPFSLQPLLENSIKHGFPHRGDSRTEYHISINVFKKNKMVICRIEDNGIGRAASSAIRQKRNNSGIGLSNTQTRLAAANIRMEIHDLVDTRGDASGTAVELIFQD